MKKEYYAPDYKIFNGDIYRFRCFKISVENNDMSFIPQITVERTDSAAGGNCFILDYELISHCDYNGRAFIPLTIYSHTAEICRIYRVLCDGAPIDDSLIFPILAEYLNTTDSMLSDLFDFIDSLFI